MKKYVLTKGGRQPKMKTEIFFMAAIELHTEPNPFFEPRLIDLKDQLEDELKAMPRRSIACPPEMFSLVLEPEYNPKVLRVFRNNKNHTSDWATITIKEE